MVSAPERAVGILRTTPAEALAAACAPTPLAMAAFMPEARMRKRDAALVVALAAAGGLWSQTQAMRAWSRFADAIIAGALRSARAEIAPRDSANIARVKDRGMFVLALGKLGADELNHSSDVDLIAFHASASLPEGGTDPTRTAARIAQRMATALQQRTDEGQVFRVDWRLRPDPSSTPLSLDIDAARLYYEAMGQGWERMAFIRARPVAGDMELARKFLHDLAPSMWRRDPDPRLIEELAEMARRARGAAPEARGGWDIKRGAGGIRAIELFTHIHALVSGGRDANLRVPGTRDILARLARAGWIPRRVAVDLGEAYVFFRTLEDRVQMFEDKQTHLVPTEAEAMASLACFMGMADTDALLRAIERRVALTRRDASAPLRLEERTPSSDADAAALFRVEGGGSDAALEASVARLGFQRPGAALALTRAWRQGRMAATLSASALPALSQAGPALARAIADTGTPDATLAALDVFVRAAPVEAQVFAVLAKAPALARTLIQALTVAPGLSSVLRRRAGEAFDIALSVVPARSIGTMRAEARALAASEATLERRARDLDAWTAITRFGVGWTILTDPARARAGSRFAVVAEETLRAACEYLLRAHGFAPSSVAVLAFGSLGERSMGFDSDMDLVVVYDDMRCDSRAAQRFARDLVARLAPSYSVDARLRPHGAAGPMASSLEAFRAFYAKAAWRWERLAAVAGRVAWSAGAAMTRRTQAVLRAAQTPTEADLSSMVDNVREALALRRAGRPARGSRDVERADGGLEEFAFVHRCMILAGQRLDASSQRLAMRARREMDALRQVMRLCPRAFDAVPPEGVAALMAGAMRTTDLASMDARLENLRGRLAAIRDTALDSLARAG